MPVAGKAPGERGKAQGKSGRLAGETARGGAALKVFGNFGGKLRRAAHEKQEAAQAVFKRADMAGEEAQGTGLHGPRHQAACRPERRRQHKEYGAQAFPGAARGAGGQGLCDGDAAFDHAGQFGAARDTGESETRDLPQRQGWTPGTGASLSPFLLRQSRPVCPPPRGVIETA